MLAADVGYWGMNSLFEVIKVKRFSLDDETALKTVVGLQTRGDGGDNLELQVAQVADTA